MNAQGYYKKLITSPRWVKLRAEKVANNPLCENCLLSDITTPTEEVHHIRPVESAPDQHTMLLLCFDYNNLQSLCSKCHKTVHIELKSYTKEETQKRNKAKTDNFVAKFLKRHNPPWSGKLQQSGKAQLCFHPPCSGGYKKSGNSPAKLLSSGQS